MRAARPVSRIRPDVRGRDEFWLEEAARDVQRIEHSSGLAG